MRSFPEAWLVALAHFLLAPHDLLGVASNEARALRRQPERQRCFSEARTVAALQRVPIITAWAAL